MIVVRWWRQKCNSFPTIGELLGNCSIPIHNSEKQGKVVQMLTNVLCVIKIPKTQTPSCGVIWSTVCHHYLVLLFCKWWVIKLEFSILRIVGVINQRMRPSLATGECQIPNASDYPILHSCVPFLEINLLPQNSKENDLQLINIVQIKISQIPF